MTAAIETMRETRTGAAARVLALLAAHRGALAALGVRIAAAALGYGVQIALARLLGATDYGVFAYAWAWLAIAGFGATFGLGQTSVRWLAHYHEKSLPARSLGFVRWSLCVVLIGAVLVALAGYGLLRARPDWLDAPYLVPMLLMLPAVPLFALGDLAEGFARSQGRTLLALAPPYLLRPALLVAALPLASLAGLGLSATTAMAAALAATALTTALQLALALRLIAAGHPAGLRADYNARGWARAAAPVFLSDIAQVLRQNVDLILLGAYVPPGRVALYFAATRVAGLLGLIEFAVGAAAGHRFARAAATADDAALAGLVRQSSHLTFWPTLLGALAIGGIAPFVLALFGESYAGGSTLVTVLAAGYVARAAIGPAEELLIMRGHSGAALGAQLAGLAATLALGLLLIPVIGAMGAAFAASASLIVTTTVLALASRHHTGLWPLPLPPQSTEEHRS